MTRVPLCEINLEVPVRDISVVDDDMFVVATVNGLTAIRIDAELLQGDSLAYPRASLHE